MAAAPSQLELAMVLCVGAHVGQVRKYTGIPYAFHPMEVASIAAEYGGLAKDENALIAALLHDVLEDTDIPESEIRATFGDDVGDLVVELTEVVVEGNRAARKEAERERLSKISPRAQTIKYADLISNTRSIADNDKDFAKVYLKEKQAILDTMMDGDPALYQMAWDQVERCMYKCI